MLPADCYIRGSKALGDWASTKKDGLENSIRNMYFKNMYYFDMSLFQNKDAYKYNFKITDIKPEKMREITFEDFMLYMQEITTYEIY